MGSEENFKISTRINILRLKRDAASMRQEQNTMKNNGKNKKEALKFKIGWLKKI